MPVRDGVGQGLVMLQLKKWSQLPFELNPLDFVEAFISPSKELLVLHSYESEALLLPLTGDGYSDKGVHNPGCTPSNSPQLVEVDGLGLLSNVSLADISNDILPTKSSLCSVICNAKSLAWGHFGDSYDRLEDSCFRELLVMSTDDDIIVHIFHRPDKNIQSAGQLSDDAVMLGTWVEWCPHRRWVEDRSTLDSNGSICSNEIGSGGKDGSLCLSGTGAGLCSYDCTYNKKKRLRSFVIEPEVSMTETEWLLRVPQKQPFPCSAEVVSFSIYQTTIMFREFLYQKSFSCKTKDQLGETISVRPTTFDDFRTCKTSTLESNTNYSSKVDTSFQCSKVFGGSSHRLIGVVLKCLDTTENIIDEKEGNIFVVVIMVFHWGVQWLCCVDLQCLRKGQGVQSEWVDFQFFDNLLVCLDISGLICIYDTKFGDNIAQIRALESCGLYYKLLDTDHGKLFKGDPCPIDANNESTRDGIIEGETYLHSVSRAQRSFNRLIISSSSLLLAAIDELGVIYVIPIQQYLPGSHKLAKDLCLFQDFLSRWKVASDGIGNHKVISDLPDGQNDACDISLNKNSPSNINGEMAYCMKKKLNNVIFPDYKINSFENAFALYRLNNCQACSSSCLRRVHMPINGHNKNDCIGFTSHGLTRLVRNFNGSKYEIVHRGLYVTSVVEGDVLAEGYLGQFAYLKMESTFVGDAIGCCFGGSLYLVTQDGLFIVIPTISLLPEDPCVDNARHLCGGTAHTYGHAHNLEKSVTKPSFNSWKKQIIERVILYEGPEEAEAICSENGWDLNDARIWRMQLALHYLRYDEIERSLDMLAEVNLAEEGIVRLIFASVYQMTCLLGGDDGRALATRFLSLAACFATKMIRKYSLLEYEQVCSNDTDAGDLGSLHVHHGICEFKQHNFRRLAEVSLFLEAIRNIQHRLYLKGSSPSQVEDIRDPSIVVDPDISVSEPSVPSVSVSENSSLGFNNLVHDQDKNLELLPEGLPAAIENGNTALQVKLMDGENPKEMIARWAVDNLELREVVREALLADRLPLAVFQLHLQHLKELVSGEEPLDTFSIVRHAGRAIAYEMFVKGEMELATTTLHRLGDDVEIGLRKLLFGTTRSSLRRQTSELMKRLGYLKSYESNILKSLSLIERSYPYTSFWGTYMRKHSEVTSAVESEVNRSIMCLKVWDGFRIECRDANGAVLDPWVDASEDSAVPEADDDSTDPSGYWVCAAAWSDAWDEQTIDRIILDQQNFVEKSIPWESQLAYCISCNDWGEVEKLLDDIPVASLTEGSLKIKIGRLKMNGDANCNDFFINNANLICLSEELDSELYEIPNIKIFRPTIFTICASWMKILIERKLANNLIFLREYWESTSEFFSLIASIGFSISRSPELPDASFLSPDMQLYQLSKDSHHDSWDALHKLVLHYCTQYNLTMLMELYLDHHKIYLDKSCLSSLQEVIGDCEWANWLLLTMIKGCEYDASFANSRCIFSKSMVSGGNLCVLEMDEIVITVDDMAEGGGELAALATLMYAPVPIQNCLCKGSVSRHGSAFQCTLENLKHDIQKFPTLWNTLVASSFGQDPFSCLIKPSVNSGLSQSALSDYLIWRDTLFSSAGGDTSLIQMLPCWFSKSIRRLIKIFVQGPPRWQSTSGTISTEESFLLRQAGLHNSVEGGGFNALSWEVAIQRSSEELYSSFQERMLGVEHHLHRGRALAAFSHLLGLRTRELKSRHHQATAGSSAVGQMNLQSDIHALLGTLTLGEISQVSSVGPLAIMHFEDSVLVASCAFLLELCGLSANMLRLDVAVLERISSYYHSAEPKSPLGTVSPNASRFNSLPTEDLIISLARSLADNYLQHQNVNRFEQNGTSTTSWRLRNVLQHLEKVSLPSITDGKTCGSWLSSGFGDGIELRSRQKVASHYWSLVTSFCQMHRLPVSPKYLAVLAKDNDWVGFLTEAQITGFPIDTVINVAKNEFNDPRLKVHILTILKNMQSMKNMTVSKGSEVKGIIDEVYFAGSNDVNPVELFGLISECEINPNPGEALLLKAKDLRWPLLALVASCFPDAPALSCLIVWLEISVARETSSIKLNDVYSRIARNVGAAVDATNALPVCSRTIKFHYNRKNPKRGRRSDDSEGESPTPEHQSNEICVSTDITNETDGMTEVSAQSTNFYDAEESLVNLSNMISVLCEQHMFLPLLRSFEMFLPSSSLLPFIRSLQAFSQMRLNEASAHLAIFSSRIREQPVQMNSNRQGHIGVTWICSITTKAANAMLGTCSSAYEKRCLLLLLSNVDFHDGGSAAAYFQRLYWKVNLSDPLFRKGGALPPGAENLDDFSLLEALEKSGQWEDARNWAKQLGSSDAPCKSYIHHVTEMQAEAMVAEWKEFLWDVPVERAAIWGHCQTLFIRHSFPALQAGQFFLRHAEAIENDIPSSELHELLLLSLQWLSGFISQTDPVFPLHLLREIETRVWLLAVESEAQYETDRDFTMLGSSQNHVPGNKSIIEQTASIISRMDSHINGVMVRSGRRNGTRETGQSHTKSHVSDPGSLPSGTRTKRKSKVSPYQRRSILDIVDTNSDEDYSSQSQSHNGEYSMFAQTQNENLPVDAAYFGWDERIQPAQLERAILSLLEFGQIQAARQLQQKLSPTTVPSELVTIDVALRLASISSGSSSVISISVLDPEVRSVIGSLHVSSSDEFINQVQILELLAVKCSEGCGRGLCNRIIAVFEAAKALSIPFSEAFEKRPVELLQLLSLKAQECFDEAKLLVQTHVIPSANIACILAESFLKGLLAAHRGGYIDSQKEEGPAPLLWRFSDFFKWAELCPSESEVGHALTRLVMTSQEIPHACEVELLILAHHFYKSSSCLGGVDVLVTLAANRVESYISEGDFSCLARLVTGVGNFHALNFILTILIENGQLDLLLQKHSTEEVASDRIASVQGFRMAVLAVLNLFEPHDLDAIAMVQNHFDMKHETAAILESRAELSLQKWKNRQNKDRVNEDLLESAKYLTEAAEVYSTIDAGQKTHKACAHARLIDLQIRFPDTNWLDLTDTKSRRLLSDQTRFEEALIVAEAYGLNKPSEWSPVLWNLMQKSDLTEQFITEFVDVLPLQSSMLNELAKYYRNELTARGERSHFSWLTSGGMSAERAKLAKLFRSLLKKTRDFRVRMQLASTATGFADVVNSCAKVLDKIPDNSGPQILRRGHGGAYLPLM